MRKFIFLFALLFSATFLPAQTAPPADDNTVSMANLKGLLRLQLTITPSWMIKGSSGDQSTSISSGRTNIYLHGTAEYYFTERFSMRGDGYYFINKDKANDTLGGLKHNHSLQVGASWHLRKGMGIDPFIGVCAGISVVQIYPVNYTRASDGLVWNYPAPAHIEPVWAPRVGINFFGERVFHFFVEAQYLMGTYRPPVGPILSLNEVRVSAGLGFNFVILHKEATVRPGI
jgi:hypothetical protein